MAGVSARMGTCTNVLPVPAAAVPRQLAAKSRSGRLLIAATLRRY